jgi:sensor histidine kinase YesM
MRSPGDRIRCVRAEKSTIGYWLLQVLGWGFYFYAQASGEVIFASVPWSSAATMWGGVCLAGIALTHSLRSIIKRRDWLGLPPGALWWRIIAAFVLISTASYIVALALSEALYGSTVAPITAALYQRLDFPGQLRNQYILILAVHGVWVAIYLAFALQRRRYEAEVRQAQMDEALRTAELRLLQSQLNPHFLFNSLNGLRSLIADEPDRAREAVTQLARMLRYTLASSDEDLVTLQREIELVEDYLSLESMRLAERLRIERDIEAAARTVRVPAMLLQTLVENAIKHGIAALKLGGTLRMSAHIEHGELVLRVTNPRETDATSSSDTQGIGLRNARRRLRLLYGERARLSLDLSQANQATAEVRLPA